MNLRVFIWLGVLIGVILLAILVLLGFFVGGDRDQFVKQTTSPDGKLVAELRQIITSRWGGPDSIYVQLTPVPATSPTTIVYSAENECSDHTFNADWNGPRRLDIFFSKCDTTSAQPAPVTRVKMDRWQEVTIQ